jgi:hypothetical protein
MATAKPLSTSPSRHSEAVELQSSDRMAGDQLEHAAGQSGGVAVDGERGDAARPRRLRGSREDRVHVGIGGVRDPGLGAGEDESLVGWVGVQLELCCVGSRTGLGEGERGHQLAATDARHPALDRRRPPRLEDRVGAQCLHRQGSLSLDALLGHSLAKVAELDR